MAAKQRGNQPDCNSLSLMLLGMTGAGKSSLGNAMLNLNETIGFPVTAGLCSTISRTAEVKTATVERYVLEIVDTPGVRDTVSHEEAISGICSGIKQCPKGVDAFILVMRLDRRQTEEELNSILDLENLFGPQFWKFAIIVFTHGEVLDNDLAKFAAQLNEARKRIPRMNDLFDKIPMSALLVDTRPMQQLDSPQVAAELIKSLLNTVDALVLINRRKFTNDLIDAVQVLAKENDTLQKALEKERRQADLLRQKYIQQQEQLKNSPKQQTELLELLRANDANIAKMQCQLEAAMKTIDALAKRKCTIL